MLCSKLQTSCNTLLLQWWSFLGWSCITYRSLFDDCTCCFQVFLELFLWLEVLSRSSCVSSVNSVVMFLPPTDNSPNGAHKNIEELRNLLVTSSTGMLRRSWESSLRHPTTKCFLYNSLVKNDLFTCIQRSVTFFQSVIVLTYQHVLSQLIPFSTSRRTN